MPAGMPVYAAPRRKVPVVPIVIVAFVVIVAVVIVALFTTSTFGRFGTQFGGIFDGRGYYVVSFSNYAVRLALWVNL